MGARGVQARQRTGRQAKLTSSDFKDMDRIPDRFTCEGEDISPTLDWSELPEDAAELALTCEDPDAPGRTFVHWLVWRIDPNTDRLGAGDVPDGARQGRNDFGNAEYGGPCPPPGHGPHRYVFTLYALSEDVGLSDGASIRDLHKRTEGKVLSEARLTGTFER